MLKNDDSSFSIQNRDEIDPELTSILFRTLLLCRAKNTQKTYQRILRDFLLFTLAETQKTPLSKEHVTAMHAEVFVAYLISNGKSASILRQTKAALTLLFEMLRKYGCENTILRFPKVRHAGEKFEKEILDKSDLWHLLFFCKEEINSTRKEFRHKFTRALRDYAIVTILIHTGMRVSELCSLANDHFTTDGLRGVKVKGGKYHFFPLLPEVQKILSEYVSVWRRTAPQAPFIVKGSPSNPTPMDRFTVLRIIKKLCKRAGIEKRIVTHTFRASVITLLHEENVPVGHIQALVGHEDPRTTLQYLPKLSALKAATTLNSLFGEKNE